MGQNKALLPVPGKASQTFVEHLAFLLSQTCAEVLLVARDEKSGRAYTALPNSSLWRLVYDQVPGQGPLMGLYSGLQATSSSHALLLAVDLPYIQPALLNWLSTFPLTDEPLLPRVQGIPQVLLARYPRSLLPGIDRCLRRGRRDLRALLEECSPRFLEEEELRRVDPELRSFRNINTPEDLYRTLPPEDSNSSG